jgi:hypothetical protein
MSVRARNRAAEGLRPIPERVAALQGAVDDSSLLDLQPAEQPPQSHVHQESNTKNDLPHLGGPQNTVRPTRGIRSLTR